MGKLLIMSIITDFAPQFQMWVVFALICAALGLYVFERASMELTSLLIVCFLLVFFHFFPIVDDAGKNTLTPVRILEGFANPALVAVLALLVMGNGMVRTGVLDRVASIIMGIGGKKGRLQLTLMVALLVPVVVSAFLNNIPVVVIFIPVMQALAHRYKYSASKFMIPLSYAAVLGGMTTLIGSSTNLLVNSSMIDSGVEPFGFFDFSVPGTIMAACGFVFVLFVAPRLLPNRTGPVDDMAEGSGKQFIAQMTISENSPLIGSEISAGILKEIPDKTLRMIQRGEETILPPFEDFVVRAGDILVVAATRQVLTKTLSDDPDSLHPKLDETVVVSIDDDKKERWQEGEQVVAEVMVAPGSGLNGLSLSRIGFRYKTHCVVLGIQRRSRMLRSRMTDIALESGDVLLVQGQPEDISRLKTMRDVVLLEWSAKDLPALKGSKRATIIFLAVVALSASGIMPIVVSALCGAVAMVMLGVLNLRQAFQAADKQIITTIAAALALGVALNETGGASFIASSMADALEGASVPVILSCFFLLVAVLANLISTKTCAVLFTPIAIDLASKLEVSHIPFTVAVIFAANCSFASPLGYQTNLLVMGPGHYKFIDYSRAGIPLIILMWVVFSFLAPWYYDLS